MYTCTVEQYEIIPSTVHPEDQIMNSGTKTIVNWRYSYYVATYIELILCM